MKLSKGSGELLPNPDQYRRLIGKLMYLTLCRPDIIYAVHRLTQFLAATRILQYIKGTQGQGVFLFVDSDLHLKAYYDTKIQIGQAALIQGNLSLVIVCSWVML